MKIRRPTRHVRLTTSAVAGALVATTALSSCAASGGSADSYPERRIQVTVPYAPGGGTDIATRLLTDALEREIGQSVVVVNEEGGGGAVAVAKNAQANPDGYQLSVAIDSNLTLQPTLISDLDYDSTSFDSIGFNAAPFVLVAASDAPFDDLEELVDAAGSAPGEIRISTPGDGTSNDMAARALALATDTEFTMAPFTSGGADAVNAVLSGEVEMASTTVAVAQGLVEAGKLKIVGSLSAEDAPGAEDSQSLEEAGIDSELAIESNLYLNVPTGADDAIIAQLEETMQAIVESEEYAAAAADLGYVVGFTDTEASADQLGERSEVYDTILAAFPSLQAGSS